MQQTTDPAARVAARLAREMIRQANTLTIRQIGIIADALDVPGETTRTVDLATEAAPSRYHGQRAVWRDAEGREHVGVLAPDPRGGCWPIVRFPDGTYGRTGGTVEVVVPQPVFSSQAGTQSLGGAR